MSVFKKKISVSVFCGAREGNKEVYDKLKEEEIELQKHYCLLNMVQ